MGRRKDNKGRVLRDCEYQRSNGTYEYKWVDDVGKRKSVYAKTLDELRKKEESVRDDKRDGIKRSSLKLTVNDMYRIWCDVKRGLKNNTMSNYRYMYELFVEPEFGQRKLLEVKKSAVRQFYNRLYEVNGLKVNTIDGIHTVLHQVFQLAVDDEYLRSNPSDNALKELKKAHGNDQKKRRALTLNQQQLLVDYLAKENGKHHRWYPIIVTLLWTGMRIGECTGLTWNDIDFNDNEISINHTLVYYDKRDRKKANNCVYAINTPKTEAGRRTIPMLPIVRESLLMEKQMQEELGIRSRSCIDGYQDFVFVNRFGDVLNNGPVNRAIARIITDCNLDILEEADKKRLDKDNLVMLPHFSCHNLRHTMTTRMCEAGMNIKVMQEILGHADAETTMDIYAEASKELKHAEIIDLSAYFQNMKVSNQ